MTEIPGPWLSYINGIEILFQLALNTNAAGTQSITTFRTLSCITPQPALRGPSRSCGSSTNNDAIIGVCQTLLMAIHLRSGTSQTLRN